MTGRPGAVAEHTAAELQALRLGATTDGIPTLDDLLGLVAGQVPLVIELKGTNPFADDIFLDRVRPIVERYGGPLALMSFDPWLIAQAVELRDIVPIGLTAEGTRSDCLDRHRELFAPGCSFVSYNVHHLPNAFVSWVREERRLPVISWTVRTPDDVERSLRHADQMTFEGFLPQV